MARSHLHAMIGNCDSVKSLKAPFACLTDLWQGWKQSRKLGNNSWLPFHLCFLHRFLPNITVWARVGHRLLLSLSKFQFKGVLLLLWGGGTAVWCCQVFAIQSSQLCKWLTWPEHTHNIRVEVGKQPLPPQPHLPPWTAQLYPSRDAFFLPIEIFCMLMHFWELAFASTLVIGDWSASSGFMEKSPLRE